MTALPPDPDPAEMPTVADAHGVEPGETPPDSGSTPWASATVGISAGSGSGGNAVIA